MARQLISIFFLLSACTSAPSSWVLHSIAEGDPPFSRLRYLSSAAHPALSFELLKISDELTAFVHLTRFRFTDKQQVKISLTINGTAYEEQVAVHEGAMRLRLGVEMTKRLIQALQDGLEVGILVDGFEETLTPNPILSDFLGEGNILK